MAVFQIICKTSRRHGLVLEDYLRKLKIFFKLFVKQTETIARSPKITYKN